MGRGLGFSGAARVAGLVAAWVQRCGPELKHAEYAADVLARATALEGHADNVAASLHGGVVATAAGYAVKVPMAIEPAVVLWVPSFTTSTDQSRSALGLPVSFSDVVFNMDRKRDVLGFLITTAFGSAPGPRVSRLAKLALVSDKKALRSDLERLAQLPELTRVIVAHEKVASGPEARATLLQAATYL